MTATQVSDGAAPQLRERRAELRAIEAALGAARGDEGQLLLLSGPAGVGKTALLRAAIATATESGFLVLGARGGELEQSFPFGVVGQLFAPVVHDAKEQGSEEDLLAGDARLAELALSPAPGVTPARRGLRAAQRPLLAVREPVRALAGAARRRRRPLGRRGVAAVSVVPGSSWRWHGAGARGRRAHGRARSRRRSLRRAWTRGPRAADRARPAERGRGLRPGAGAVVGGRERRALPGVSRGDARQRVPGRAGHRRAAPERQAPHGDRGGRHRRRGGRGHLGGRHGPDRPAGTGRPCAGRGHRGARDPGRAPARRRAREARAGSSRARSPTVCGRPESSLPGACSSSSIL